MKAVTLVILSAMITSFGAIRAGDKDKKLDLLVQQALDHARVQLLRSVEQIGDSVMYPRSTNPNGSWKKVAPEDWTSGFFPGLLWYMYEYTRDVQFRNAAERFTEGLERLQHFPRTHDLGFMVFNSYGQGYRLHPNEKYKNVILQTAKTLTSRFNPTVGCIKSWDNPKWEYPVIVDNMMNLELLLWVAKNGGPKEYYDLAISHADKTIQNHFRDDGGTFHVVSYDTTNGDVRVKNTHQGFADHTTWARGQAWAIYGYTMTYRFTKEKRYLDAARKAADYFLKHLPCDHVPYWDFQAPGIPVEPRDASASAIVASALFELSGYVQKKDREGYLNAAKNILTALSEKPYISTGTLSSGILNHATGNRPGGTEIDVSLIYGDYYFVEALLRYQNLK